MRHHPGAGPRSAARGDGSPCTVGAGDRPGPAGDAREPRRAGPDAAGDAVTAARARPLAPKPAAAAAPTASPASPDVPAAARAELHAPILPDGAASTPDRHASWREEPHTPEQRSECGSGADPYASQPQRPYAPIRPAGAALAQNRHASWWHEAHAPIRAAVSARAQRLASPHAQRERTAWQHPMPSGTVSDVGIRDDRETPSGRACPTLAMGHRRAGRRPALACGGHAIALRRSATRTPSGSAPLGNTHAQRGSPIRRDTRRPLDGVSVPSLLLCHGSPPRPSAPAARPQRLSSLSLPGAARLAMTGVWSSSLTVS